MTVGERRTVVPCILLSAPVIFSISCAFAWSKSIFLSSLYFCAISSIIASISLTVKFLFYTDVRNSTILVAESLMVVASNAVYSM